MTWCLSAPAICIASETNSTRWAGPASWERWYQPIIDAALERDGRVVAANAPRRYVRAARSLGYEAMEELEPGQRALFELPVEPIDDDYRAAFFEVMGGDGHGEPLSEEQIESFFRAHCVWDATMAGSVADAGPSRERKVVLLVGRFHTDHEGGTLQQLRHRRPGVTVLSLSCVAADGSTLAEEDLGRADVIVHCGPEV